MDRFFCAERSQQLNEDRIGSAPTPLMYVLIECPLPWAPKELDSKGVPANLRVLIETIKAAQLSVRFLLFAGEEARSRVWVYRKQEGFSQGYGKREFEVNAIADVAPLLEQYLTAQGLEIPCEPCETEDYFICTHGSHDKCCARFGYPFYRQAVERVQHLKLEQVNVWQVSHIGGHRFAPTLVHLPSGRYYGGLDRDTFEAMLQRSGNIEQLRAVYRGWGILPKQAQVMERELLLQHGWQWLDYAIEYQILERSETSQSMRLEIRAQTPEQLVSYQAEVVEAETIYLKGSCSSETDSKVTKFRVRELRSLSSCNKSAETFQRNVSTVCH